MSWIIVTTFCIGLVYGYSSNDEAHRFMVIGDMGGLPFFPYTTPVEMGVAKQMADMANKINPDFILSLGDNFYFNGVRDVTDSRFEESYEKIFDYPSLKRPWYLIAGNHDHHGNVSAEIAYSKVSQRWNFPDFYYPLSFKLPGTNSTIDILMLDTITLCGNTESDFKGSQPIKPDNYQASEQQWAWLEQSLAVSKATYLLVAGHFPVYSIAEHGPTECLVDRLLPMLYKYKVTAYMSGHDHNLQHLQDSQNGVTADFFVVGASNFIDPSRANANAVPVGASKFHWANLLSLGGFGYVDVSTSNLTFSFIEADGKLLYQTVMKPRTL
ncbi:tartrate-resistant acid phosphatase type 5-like [Patella vulgata]|uniref:tartrate-resistant acid phosphatase type 5-like n=1 Tax=Patella vulgata TaxID=6465 RepID=UPI0021801BA4|nr:tartrate-resistant acid phosphatase type 5-like [Patella vulgata]